MWIWVWVNTMASKSFRNVVSTLALANGLALSMKQWSKAKTTCAMADRLDRQCELAFQCWPESLEQSEIGKIYAKLERFHAQAMPQDGRPELLTSIALGLIDDAMLNVKDPVKRTALERVEAELWKVHRYYDRALDRHETYEIATSAIRYWHEQFD